MELEVQWNLAIDTIIYFDVGFLLIISLLYLIMLVLFRNTAHLKKRGIIPILACLGSMIFCLRLPFISTSTLSGKFYTSLLHDASCYWFLVLHLPITLVLGLLQFFQVSKFSIKRYINYSNIIEQATKLQRERSHRRKNITRVIAMNTSTNIATDFDNSPSNNNKKVQYAPHRSINNNNNNNNNNTVNSNIVNNNNKIENNNNNNSIDDSFNLAEERNRELYDITYREPLYVSLNLSEIENRVSNINSRISLVQTIFSNASIFSLLIGLLVFWTIASVIVIATNAASLQSVCTFHTGPRIINVLSIITTIFLFIFIILSVLLVFIDLMLFIRHQHTMSLWIYFIIDDPLCLRIENFILIISLPLLYIAKTLLTIEGFDLSKFSLVCVALMFPLLYLLILMSTGGIAVTVAIMEYFKFKKWKSIFRSKFNPSNNTTIAYEEDSLSSQQQQQQQQQSSHLEQLMEVLLRNPYKRWNFSEYCKRELCYENLCCLLDILQYKTLKRNDVLKQEALEIVNFYFGKKAAFELSISEKAKVATVDKVNEMLKKTSHDDDESRNLNVFEEIETELMAILADTFQRFESTYSGDEYQ